MKNNKQQHFSLQEITAKIEYFCSYQDRCHKEVEAKLYHYSLIPEAKEKILLHLIENNFLNEERFAKSFIRGKHNYKAWGKLRIERELKQRDISVRIIREALNEIPYDTYFENFNLLAEKHWDSINEANPLKKNKKFCDFLFRKGYESNLIYEKLNQLSN